GGRSDRGLRRTLRDFGERAGRGPRDHRLQPAARIAHPRPLTRPGRMSELDLIETDRLVLSGWRRDQNGDLVRLRGNREISRYLGNGGAPWPAEKCAASLESWIEMFDKQRLGKLRVTRKSDGVLVGRAGYGLHGGEPEIGYALYPEYQGHGYATE